MLRSLFSRSLWSSCPWILYIVPRSKFSLAISQKHHLPGKTWYQRYLCPLSKIRSHEIEGSEMLLLLPTRGKFQWGKFQITFDTFWYQAVSNTKFNVLIKRPGIQMINSIKKRCKIIPHFCAFCYTATLFRPVKSALKITYIPDVLAKIGQNGPI